MGKPNFEAKGADLKINYIDRICWITLKRF